MDPDTDAAATRSRLLERASPRESGGLEFAELPEELATTTFVTGIPDRPAFATHKTAPPGRARGRKPSMPSAGATAKAPKDKDEAKAAKTAASGKATLGGTSPASADSRASKPAKGKPGRSTSKPSRLICPHDRGQPLRRGNPATWDPVAGLFCCSRPAPLNTFGGLAGKRLTVIA